MIAYNIFVGLVLIVLGASTFGLYTYRDHSSTWGKMDDYSYSFKGVIAIIVGICLVFQVIDLAGQIF